MCIGQNETAAAKLLTCYNLQLHKEFDTIITLHYKNGKYVLHV